MKPIIDLVIFRRNLLNMTCILLLNLFSHLTQDITQNVRKRIYSSSS